MMLQISLSEVRFLEDMIKEALITNDVPEEFREALELLEEVYDRPREVA